MLCRLFSYYQIIPAYLDFLTIFGQESRHRDLRYSGFRGKTRLTTPPRPETVALDLGRSGRHIQMCYNLISVTCLTPPTAAMKDKQWSRRPVALYHRFDVVEGNALWVITSGGRYFRGRLEDTVGLPGRAEDRDYSTLEAAFRSAFAVHALAAHWAKEGWPTYIQWLEEVIEQSVSFACFFASAVLLQCVDGGNHYRIYSLIKHRPAMRFMAQEANTSKSNTPPKISKTCNITRTGPTKRP